MSAVSVVENYGTLEGKTMHAVRLIVRRIGGTLVRVAVPVRRGTLAECNQHFEEVLAEWDHPNLQRKERTKSWDAQHLSLIANCFEDRDEEQVQRRQEYTTSWDAIQTQHLVDGGWQMVLGQMTLQVQQGNMMKLDGLPTGVRHL